MKKAACIAVMAALLPTWLGCAKPDGAPDVPGSHGCSEVKDVPVTAHDVSSAEVLTANDLFDRNNLDRRNFRYTRYLRETQQTFFPPFAAFVSQVVGVEEYTNGVRILTGRSNFAFKDGVFTYRAGRPSVGTRLGPAPVLEAAKLRSLFAATVSAVDPGRINWVSQCVSAEFGYYDLNASTGNTTENLVKAWRVSLKNQEFPVAYYQDNGGTLIYYDNGIRTFR